MLGIKEAWSRLTGRRGGQPLATLTPAELGKVLDQRRLLVDATVKVTMLQCSYQVLWRALKQKYVLPDNIELDDKTGQIFAKEENG